MELRLLFQNPIYSPLYERRQGKHLDVQVAPLLHRPFAKWRRQHLNDIYICISNWGLPRAFVIFEIVSSDLFKGYELIWANFLKQFGGLGESLFQKKCFVNRSKIAHPNFGYITLMEK